MELHLPNLLAFLRTKLDFTKFPSKWKILAIFFALLNLKSLPLAWHFRLLYGLIQQIRSSRCRLKQLPGPIPLFAPLVTSSYASPLECDYNLHKSNSTYFIDSDVGRMHLGVALFGEGMKRLSKQLKREAAERKTDDVGDKSRGTVTSIGKTGQTRWTEEARGGVGVHLGGVNALFRREIKPLQRYEVWTRILAWDEKWLYLVQHFVRKGAVRPGRVLLQPGRPKREHASVAPPDGLTGNGHVHGEGEGKEAKANGTEPSSNGSLHVAEADHLVSPAPATKIPDQAIYATLIAKYVFKQGRKTIPPEHVLRASDLLPPMPPDTPTAAVQNGGPAEASRDVEVDVDVEGKWDWSRVQRENARGLKMAKAYAALDGLHEEFPGEGADVVGYF